MKIQIQAVNPISAEQTSFENKEYSQQKLMVFNFVSASSSVLLKFIPFQAKEQFHFQRQTAMISWKSSC
ncbi:MAG: hypothetical protein R2771_10755 [Saprospiraceae bacterium]